MRALCMYWCYAESHQPPRVVVSNHASAGVMPEWDGRVAA